MHTNDPPSIFPFSSKEPSVCLPFLRWGATESMVTVRVAEIMKRQHVPSANSDSVIGAEPSKCPQVDVLQ